MNEKTIIHRFFIPKEPLTLFLAAVGVGLLTGGSIWVFKWFIEWFHQLFFIQIGGELSASGKWTIVFIPVLGGLLVGLTSHFFIKTERYEGVAGIIESVALAGGRLRFKRMPIKALASALSIGSGGSVGPEDPSVQLGANAGSMIGQMLLFSEDRLRTLVAAGAAAGIAAAFNAPIAGIFFAVEIIIGQIEHVALSIIVIAAVSSSILTQIIAGSEPAFHVPAFAFHRVAEIPFYLILGVLAGPLSAAYVYLLGFVKGRFRSLSLPRWAITPISGLLVGLTGIFLPQIFGVGYETIEAVLNNQIDSILLLIALLIAKLILTPISIGGGFMGGVFAPALFLGAMLGGGLGLVIQQTFPTLNTVPATYAMVGMAAVLAGSVHAPLTAIMLLFEMTGDYHIILPLMFAVIVSWVISRFLNQNSVYLSELARKGIYLERGRVLDILNSIRVEEVMLSNPPIIQANQSVQEASARLLQRDLNFLLVCTENLNLVGILTREDLRLIQQDQWKEKTAAEICSRDIVFAFPDETIGEALRRMSFRDIGQLPVVAREDHSKPLGVLRRVDILQAYDTALMKRTIHADQKIENQLDAITEESVKVFEITLQAGNPHVGKKVKEITLPADGLLVRLRRKQKVWIPKGDTVLREGDRILVICNTKDWYTLHRQLTAGQ
jgi:CIC family chloride channel protein